MASLDRALEFCVVTTDGQFVRGYSDNQIALADAQGRNEQAEELGIKTRYTSGKTEKLCHLPEGPPKEEPAKA